MLSVFVMTRAGMFTTPFGHRRELVLGRSQECDVPIGDERASRTHAKLVVNDGRVWAVDLGSSNGTRVGARRLEAHRPAPVEVGDVLLIGSAAVLVRSAESPRSAAEEGAERVRDLVRVRLDVGDIDSESRIELEALASAAWAADGAPRPAAAPIGCGVMTRLAPIIERIAASSISVLLLGETGAGKEVLARTLHAASPRARSPMLCLSCAAMSETLLESELFGYERGAFTGALQAKPGLLETAEGGTLFLDEVGELPLSIQAKLLRVLEAREVRRIGALQSRPIDVRFIAATHRDLLGDAADGRFRSDLFFRLNGVSLTVPPLRERREEIEPLARAFVEQACRDAHRDVAPSFTRHAMSLLLSHSWPGNVRELRNVVERAVLLSGGDAITPLDLVWDAPRLLAPSIRRPSWDPRSPATPLEQARTPPSEPPPPTMRLAPPVRIDPEADERARIVDALRSCAGNQTQAAKVLGITRRRLIARIEHLKLRRPRKNVA